MRRITVKHVDAQVDALNTVLGKNRGDIGSISFTARDNGYGLAYIINEGGGYSTFYVEGLTKVSVYVDGMRQGVVAHKYND